MKKLLIVMMVIAGSLVATSAKSQVQVSINFEREYPGYTYYTYPAWHGHYRDRVYYEHYHRTFERRNRPYFRGRQFDRDRFEREKHWKGGNDRDRHDNRH